ncbi:sigma-70 family RNA polymerase sigma factor [Labedella endophytica]|uniref:sigma-70 family RNA polymerase sigma factor n=1 Tax=Labedella endophytica TaxID=1523160 RepID=UPI00140D0FED|nr:sigma-70 family RNA polymerase sigma factor [Labedella endophytica]
MHDESTAPTNASGSDATPEDLTADDAIVDDVTTDDVPAYSQWNDASDGDLILYTRAGDGAAYGELWRRHARAGRTVARSFTSSLDPDDLVQESFAKIYQALQKGGGPTGAFRPYLFTTIRNTASAWGRARREASIDTLESFEDPASRDEETMAALDRSLTATAFRSLPTRWQEVLWYCEVERMTPQQVAPLLAMKPNAVAALAYRAREGLRQAWIQAHIAAVPADSEHRWTIERIGSYTRGALGKRDTGKIEAHLDGCARCTIVAAEAREVGSRIALVLLPLAAGTAGATGYLAWLQTGSSSAFTTAAMPAAVLGGHGASLGVPVDPSLLGSLTGAGAAGSGAVGSGAVGSGAATSGAVGSGGTAVGASSAGAASAGAVSAGTISAGTISAGALTTGIVSGVVALVTAGAVAATLAFSPTATAPAPGPQAGSETVTETAPTETSDERSDLSSGADPSAAGSPSSPPTTAPPSSEPQESSTPEPNTPTETSTPDDGTDTPTRPTVPIAPARPTEPAKPTEPENPVDPEPSIPSAPLITMIDQGEGDALYPVVQGYGDDGATVTIRRGTEVLAEIPSNEDGGFWVSEPLTSLPVGESEISIEQTVSGSTSAAVRQTVTVREAPSLVDPVDGAILFATDLDLTLGSAFPGAVVAGSVDDQPIFTCRYDESGTTSTCGWNEGAQWTSLGLEWHTVTVAYTDETGRTGPARQIRVFVVLPTGTTESRSASSSDEAAAVTDVDAASDAFPHPDGADASREAEDDPDVGAPAPSGGPGVIETGPSIPAIEETETGTPDSDTPDVAAPDAETSDAETSDAETPDSVMPGAPSPATPATPDPGSTTD